MGDATTATFIDSVETDDGKFDVWSTTGSLDVETLYVSQFAEDDVRPVEDPEVEQFIRNELE
jgi:hypothetical protein